MTTTPHNHWIQPFEIEVLRIMTRGILSPGVLEAALKAGEFVSYEYNGYGYYLTFCHPRIPAERIVCGDSPVVVGDNNNIEAGFVVFIEENQIRLECFPFDGTSIPETLRRQTVQIRRI